MVLLPSPEDFSSASGVIDMGDLNQIYKACMDETFLPTGLARTITLHLPPTKVQDPVTQAQPQPSQYNPYFGRVQAPRTNRRNAGVTITPRDIQFSAQIKIGPTKEGEDTTGIGDLAANQVACTLDITALSFAKQAQSMTVEGRRYDIDITRPVGFTERSYVIVRGTEIDDPSNSRQGTTDG
jgi:hypothetical protein